MLKRVVHFSLRYSRTVAILALLLVGYGIYEGTNSEFDVFPDFVPPQVTVQTESPGLSAEDVELLVTKPLENNLNGSLGLESIRSESIQGLSIITLVFKEGVSLINARQLLSERLTAVAPQLPVGVKSPKMTPLVSATMDLLKIGLIAPEMNPRELRDFADWTIKPRLLAVPGVAKVSVFGGEVRQLQIQIRPDRLQALALSLTDVANAARLSSGVRGAGFIETANQRITIESEGQSLTPELLGEVIIGQYTNQPVRLADVAYIVEAAEPKYGECLIQGKAGVLLTMSSQMGANTLTTTRLLEEALKELKPLLVAQKIILYDRLHRPATFIENSLHHMKIALFIGGILVALVLTAFLLNWRTALISLTAIPLSLLGALLILERFGVGLNVMTLGGLAIAIGEVVDDAIIDVENIFRRLRQQSAINSPASTLRVISSASLEVRSAVVFATFIVALVFVPVIKLGGLQGRFFAPLGIAYVLAILCSLVVALTATPALAYLLLRPGKVKLESPRWISMFRSNYESFLSGTFKIPVLILFCAILLFAGAAVTTPFLGREFLPEFREGHYVVQLAAAPGTALEEMRRLGQKISLDLLRNPHIATVEEQIGRAEAGEDPWGPNRAEMHVELKSLTPEVEAGVPDEIRELLAHYPGISSEVLTFLGDRIGESISGETAQVSVSVFGDDLDELDTQAGAIAKVLKEVPGQADVQLKSPSGLPKMRIKLRHDRLRQFGFTPVEVLDAIETAYQGSTVGQLYEGEKSVNIVVILEPGLRDEPERIGELLLQNRNGLRLPLSELADIDPVQGRSTILHDSARRRQTVTCNVTGRDIGTFVMDAKKLCATRLKLKPGYYLAFGGAAEQERSARIELLVNSSIAAIGIIILLSLVLGNGRNVTLTILNLPFAFVGGIAALWLSTHTLSLGALVGFVTLFGITVRNSIMLMSHLEHLLIEENQPWNQQTVSRAASERLIPIVMTALVTGLGLLPLALGGQTSGQEIESPMAIVILGGLISSTLLNLLLLPCLLYRFGRFTHGNQPLVRAG
jgi:CzcA family heavy metal efflux pump